MRENPETTGMDGRSPVRPGRRRNVFPRKAVKVWVLLRFNVLGALVAGSLLRSINLFDCVAAFFFENLSLLFFL